MPILSACSSTAPSSTARRSSAATSRASPPRTTRTTRASASLCASVVRPGGDVARPRNIGVIGLGHRNPRRLRPPRRPHPLLRDQSAGPSDRAEPLHLPPRLARADHLRRRRRPHLPHGRSARSSSTCSQSTPSPATRSRCIYSPPRPSRSTKDTSLPTASSPFTFPTSI